MRVNSVVNAFSEGWSLLSIVLNSDQDQYRVQAPESIPLLLLCSVKMSVARTLQTVSLQACLVSPCICSCKHWIVLCPVFQQLFLPVPNPVPSVSLILQALIYKHIVIYTVFTVLLSHHTALEGCNLIDWSIVLLLKLFFSFSNLLWNAGVQDRGLVFSLNSLAYVNLCQTLM